MMTTKTRRAPGARAGTAVAVGLACGLATGSAAKDLPRGAAAHPASSPCETFGPGYVAVAGSQTCVRLSGSVSVSATITSGGGGVGAFMAAPRR